MKPDSTILPIDVLMLLTLPSVAIAASFKEWSLSPTGNRTLSGGCRLAKKLKIRLILLYASTLGVSMETCLSLLWPCTTG